MREALGWPRPLQRLTSVHWCAYVSGAAVLIAAFIVMAQRGAPWRGDLIWTIDWAAVGFVVCGPIIAGMVAFDRDGRHERASSRTMCGQDVCTDMAWLSAMSSRSQLPKWAFSGLLY